MKKEIMQEIFESVYQEMISEDSMEEIFMAKISKYSDERGKLSLEKAYAFAYIESFQMATQFMWRVLKKMMDSDELKKELFKEMLIKAKEEEKQTGRNPFQI